MRILDLSKKFILKVQKDGLFSAVQKTQAYYHKKQKINILNDSTNKNCEIIDHNPLVSLIAVNYNGEKDLPIFLDSISKQSYTNFELIIEDNDSSDHSAKIIKKYQNDFNKIKYVKSDINLGFAAGNNYATPYCKGELYALINVDTKVDKDWLKELVDAMSQDATCGAVCSKTLFFERFQDIEFSSTHDFKIDINYFIQPLNYQKYFIRLGRENNGFIHSENNKIIISFPIQSENLEFKILKLIKNEVLFIKIGKNRKILYSVNDTTMHVSIAFREGNTINSSYIINNVGSVSIDGMPADRGIGEYDSGQYDSKQYVDFFCGVSVLLKRSLLVDRKIFISEFFAYYEDSELSKYIRNAGYNILYAPRSIVYHRHSVTSSENSPLWKLLVSRSQKIYTYDSNAKQLFEEINHIEEYYKPDINLNIYKELKILSRNLYSRLSSGEDIVEKLNSIAIYNSYWNTKGGGESHALSFANVLQEYNTVYLVSEIDFDIEELSQYYNIDLSNCRKLVQSRITTDFTKRFHIFINSTYSSNLISAVNKSYYIVLFPHRETTEEFLKCYTFLYDSEYTRRWAKKFWGENLNSRIVLPIGSLQKNIESSIKKEKIILNVGRFFIGNHCKKQLEIAKAFKLFSSSPRYDDWKLVLIGSIDATNSETMNYFNNIKKELQGLNYEIITNASRDILNDYYQKSYIYVHATGLGEDAKQHPDRFEHFGVTPVEAMTYGCIPIVYSIGGPAELIQTLKIGYTFDNIQTLNNVLVQLVSECDKNITSNILKTINNFLDNHNFTKSLEFITLKEKND